MKHVGISDCLADALKEPETCSSCGGTVRVAPDSCVACLLQSALEAPAEMSRQSFEEVLAEVEIRDTDWRIGNYQILGEINRGGMGVIYRARQRHSKRIVALKRVLSYHGDSRDTLERFRREAEAAASLDHPNILPIYEVGEAEGLPFFTMKYAPGGSLQRAAPALRGDPAECVRLLAKVTRAVAYAHAAGILHRDLKPGNVLLDARGEPLVTDFGLAKWVDASSDLTRSLSIHGTPGFIAPEQANGPSTRLSPAADIYSLGAILFDLLTGRAPFLGEHAIAVIREAAEKPAPKLRSINPAIDRDLETITARCLEREPAARYASAEALAEDLERWLQGRPILARPVSPPVQAWRWSRRNPALAAACAALLLLTCLAVARQFDLRRLDRMVREQTLAARSIAVLPFLNLDTGTPNQELAKFLAGRLQKELQRSAPARVIELQPSDSWAAGTGRVADLQAAARRGQARAVLTGTERIVDGTVRISVRLMNPLTGEVLHTRLLEFTGGSSGVAFDSAKLAHEVDSILAVADWSSLAAAPPDPGLQNPAAREFILAGRQLTLQQTRESIDRSIDCLERAISLEPRSAIARAYFASAAASRMYFILDHRYLDRAEKEATEAVRLAPRSLDVRRARAGVLYQQGRYAESIEEQLSAIELAGPEDLIGGLLGMTLDKLGEPVRSLSWYAIANRAGARPGPIDLLIGNSWAALHDDQRAEIAYQRAMDLRPELSQGWAAMCRLRVLQGQFEEAVRLGSDVLSRFPDDMDGAEAAAWAHLVARNYTEAERLYRVLAARDTDGGMRHDSNISYASALAWLRSATGDPQQARAWMEECLTRESHYLSKAPRSRAIIYRVAALEASLGRHEAALDRLSQAVEAGWIDARTLQQDPRFDALAENPGFHRIVSQLTARVERLRAQLPQAHGLSETAAARK